MKKIILAILIIIVVIITGVLIIKNKTSINSNVKEEKIAKLEISIKKNHDLEIMQAMIKQYQNEQKDMIERAHEIEVTKIQKYEQLMSDLKSEMDGLNKLLSVRSKAKDVLAIESDKKQLKELDDKVKSIQHRQKYNQTPSEIYDEIEIYLSSLDEEPAVENSEDHVPEQEDIESTLNYDYDVPNVHLEDEILDEPD